MRKISLWLFILVFTASLARAQDDATQQQIDKLSGQIQDLLDAQAAQGKRIDALEKEISDLNKEKDQITENLLDTSISFDILRQLSGRLTEITETIHTKEFRWLELSEMV